MCLTLNWKSKIEVAQEDITCWKVVMTLRDGRWMAPYRRTVHEYDTELEACGHLVVERNYFNDDVINKGFHGYTFQYVLQGDEVLYHVRVVECTIPKGAEYCLGANAEIVANKMIVHKPKCVKTFKDVKKGDTLYLVYLDPNGDRQIGEAAVTGFTDLTYKVGDRYEDWGEREVRNVNFEFQGVKFSKDLTYTLNDTHTLSGVEFGEEYEGVMGDAFVEVFTTRGLAKEYLVALLNSSFESKQEQIAKLESDIEKLKRNLDCVNNI